MPRNTTTISASVPTNIERELREEVEKTKLSFSALVTEAFDQYLELRDYTKHAFNLNYVGDHILLPSTATPADLRALADRMENDA